VFNLLLNAAHAMKGQGRIFITARHVGASSGPELELTVADEGPGIAAEHMDTIFDPFFTTGTGTGLGLSIAFGILQAHGGSLSASNRAEGGAVFTLRLPDPTGAREKETV
jgi:signal transduction histidine kinase